MNALRFILVAIVGVSMSATALAADKADNKKLIVGKWEVTEGEEGTLGKGSTAEFTADGKIKVLAKKNNQDESIEGTYTVDGDAITLMVKADGADRTVKVTIKKLNETELTLEGPDGKTVAFKKKK